MMDSDQTDARRQNGAPSPTTTAHRQHSCCAVVAGHADHSDGSTVNAYRNNVSNAGAFPRDPLDALVISQVMSLGTAGAIITSPSQTGLANNGYGTIDGGTALPDSDQDGMPDIWENATGSKSARGGQ
jgi:hypothetical protein